MARSLDTLHPEGWDLPVAQALVEPVLMAGMPRDYAVLMGTTAMVLGLALRIWWLGLNGAQGSGVGVHGAANTLQPFDRLEAEAGKSRQFGLFNSRKCASSANLFAGKRQNVECHLVVQSSRIALGG